ncbi:Sec-independent protein translocase protein TatB [Paracoccus sp. Ld10]|uniref:Sec-independent protein translocase protein TatB n=1 Tax=Paracoccus sp. Ld10 TaxID=649158 RepID=UPI00386CC23E
MLDIGWSELLMIGVVALVVIGPEDLPKLFHTLGRLMARARGMAREFTSAMEDAAKGSGLDEAAKGMKNLSSLTSKNSRGLDALDRAVTKFEKWDPKTNMGQRIQPDPAAPVADGGADAAVPAPAAQPANSATQPAGQTPAEVAPNPDSRRRISGVRRSDTKDL